jgi:ATP-dependent DNA ligase
MRKEGRSSTIFSSAGASGEDLHFATLIERKQKLRALIPESDRIIFCDHIEQHGQRLFEMVSENNLEGMVAKRKFDPYLPSTSWLKVRTPDY